MNEKTGKEDEHTKKELVIVHEDIIGDAFWKEHNYILKQEAKA